MSTRRADRYRQRGLVECGFRVVDGQQDGLSRRWCHGVGKCEQGEVTFIGTVGGVRFLKRKPVRITIEYVDSSKVRQPAGLESLTANSAAQVVRVKTTTATLEWAIPPDEVAWATGRVATK